MVKKRETRSKVITVAMKPSLLEKLQKIAYLKDLSVNTLIHTVMEQYAADNDSVVTEYNNSIKD